MSTRITTTLIDDLDGSLATGTFNFSLEGTSYAIDLNEENAAAFKSDLQKYASAARVVDTPAGTRKVRDASQPSSKEVRAWAVKNGIEVNQYGRIKDSVLAQYSASK